jgi:hypothetical protein
MNTIVSVIAAGAICFRWIYCSGRRRKHVIADLKEAMWGPAPPCCRPALRLLSIGDPRQNRRRTASV